MNPEEALALIPDLRSPVVGSVLATGATSSSFKVTDGDESYVLRLAFTDAPAELPGVVAEFAVLEQAAAAGLTPPPVFADAERGVLLRQFVPGQVLPLKYLRDQYWLSELGRLFAKLHSIETGVPEWDPVAAVGAYSAELADTEFGERTAQIAEQAAATLSGLSPLASSYLCHNDPVHSNMLVTESGKLQLIDWEFAAAGDPCFDLAVIVRHHNLAAEHENALITAWVAASRDSGGEPLDKDAVHTRVVVWKRYYQALLTLWLLVLRRRGSLDSLQEASLKVLLTAF